jgi:hypothetical protein
MSQVGYGSNDPIGQPFNYLAGANGVVTGSTIAMIAASLVINAGGTTAALTVTLPVNPPDGCVAEITSLFQTTSLTVNAATTGVAADTIVNGTLGVVTEILPVASGTAGAATNTVKYKYSLNGYINGNVPALNPRTWFRVQ